MKFPSKTTPPPCDAWLGQGAFRKVVVALVSVALIGASVFAVSVAASRPAEAQNVHWSYHNNNNANDFLIAAGATTNFDLKRYISWSGGTTLTCTTPTISSTSKMSSISQNNCVFTVAAKTTATSGRETYTGLSACVTGTFFCAYAVRFVINFGPASNLAFTAPSGLTVGTNRTLAINAASYATESHARYSISCGDATSIDTTEISAVARNGCVFTVTPTNVQGASGFTVPYTSSAGGSVSGRIGLQVGPASNIVFNAPSSNPSVQAGGSLNLSVDTYASDGSYTISCGTITESSALISLSNQSVDSVGCDVTINAGSTAGTAAISVPYISSGGHTSTQMVSVDVVIASDITFNAPTGLKVGTNRTQTIDASAYVTEANSAYTITCGDATSIDTVELQSVSQVTPPGGCVFTVTPKAVQGAASFVVPYTSSGGDTENGTISIEVGPPSAIVFTAPDPTLRVAINLTRTIDALDYVSDGSYAITCGDATGIDSTKLTSVARDSSGSGCGYTITPISTLTMSQQGDATFTVPYRSAGGHVLNQMFTITVGPASTITYTPPPTTGAGRLQVAANRQLTIDASSYVSEASSDYAISCGEAADIPTGISRIARTGCSFVVTPAAAGSATFTVPYVSQGGATENGSITIDIGAATNIVFTPPVGLRVAASSSLVVNAALYATDGSYTITCGDATGIDSTRLTSVSRTGCSFTVMSSATMGAARFTVPYTSSGGDTQNGLITLTVGPVPTTSNIVFAAPSGLAVRAGGMITIDASRYAADGANTIACGTATGVDTSKISVANTACSYTATATATATGTASFTVPYTSTGTLGSGSRNGIITISITPASDIQFTAPTDLEIGAGSTRTLSLASYATDGPYSITCGNATAAEPAKLTSIARNGCRYTITAAAAAAQGDTTFTLTYTSSGTDTHLASFTITIGPASVIVFTAPAAITLQAGSARGVDLSSYATDGSYTIGCRDATDIDTKISSVRRNGCVYTIAASSTAGDASFAITYASTGGHTSKATINITITPAPREPEERPAGPIQPIDPPERRPTPPPPTTTTTTTILDPSRPTTTLEPDQPGPRWNTLTAQPGGTTPSQIRQAFRLATGQAIYTWNTNTQTWVRATRSSQTIPAGTRVSFRTEERVTRSQMRNSNLGGGPTRMRLTTGWNTLSIPQGITRTENTNFLFDPSLTDCRNQQGIIAIAAYSTRSRRWSISLPCHPTAQRRLTTGENAPYRPLASIAPADTTYIYTRTRQPLTIRWNSDTQTYQAFQSIFG